MNAEFNWWLLIVGLVVGAGLVWLVIADWSRREVDLSQDELAAESAWIAEVLRERGQALDPGDAEEILALHRAYLRQTGAMDPAPATGVGDGADEHASFDPLDQPEWPSADDEGYVRARPATTGWDPYGDEAGTTIGSTPRAGERPSVRSTRLSPRGGSGPGLESEPPAS
jgi:hypothetical protein